MSDRKNQKSLYNHVNARTSYQAT